VSASGLAAERYRMDVISTNLANANSVKMGDQLPYQRRIVQLMGDANGVRVAGVTADQSPFRLEHDPGHPFAENGVVTYTNINPLSEMVNMISASRAYEANIAAFNSAKGMIRSALQIGKV
jgi:flagellar basal-body rod protein FlgC